MKRQEFVQVRGRHFVYQGKEIALRGFNLGNWMNIENFIMGIPGTDEQIRSAFADAYGAARADGFFKRYADSFITEADFLFFRELGINTLRIPMNYQLFVDQRHPQAYHNVGFSILDKLLGWCEQYRIFAILDLHTVPGCQNPDWHANNQTGLCQFWHDADLRNRVVGLWRVLAERYKENRWVAGYDLLNEPALVPNADVLNEFYDDAIAAVRDVDNHHVIFLEGDDWAKDFSGIKPQSDPLVAYQFHRYPDTGKYPEAYTKEEMEAVFLPMIRDLQERFGRPVLLGETGIIFVEGREEYYTQMLSHILEIMEENGVSWTLWTYKDAKTMGIVYPRANTPWMGFIRDFKTAYGLPLKMRKENDLLTFELDLANELVRHLEGNYFPAMPDPVKRRVEYRVRAMLEYLLAEGQLKPKLRELPFEEAMKLPESFVFENCDRCAGRVALLKRILK